MEEQVFLSCDNDFYTLPDLCFGCLKRWGYGSQRIYHWLHQKVGRAKFTRALTTQETLQRLSQVLGEVKPISHLNGLRESLSCGIVQMEDEVCHGGNLHLPSEGAKTSSDFEILKYIS
jgi:hypothetical protein